MSRTDGMPRLQGRKGAVNAQVCYISGPQTQTANLNPLSPRQDRFVPIGQRAVAWVPPRTRWELAREADEEI